MTSSMSTGERRWASSGRRGGMTVIGKVVVPKPINLPSQRLENHGLDPNVEIVPKGTLSWGSKSSSTASNPWGSSTPSPNTDGGGSPSRLSGRPSSGGSGTRPSTAGSDRAYEPVNNAWVQNSRPSSASGLVTSNQSTLTSLRPRSAETRPGSSHLSRFAESVSENSGVWGATGTAEKLGVTSSKNDGFSLASGDFPTLGSEKDNSEKNTESQDHDPHDRPGSASSTGVAPAKERSASSLDVESPVNENVKSDNANSWKRESPAYGEDGMKPNVEKWHGDPQPYPNANIRPHHYEAWRGPSPVNNPPGGVWYRGPPGAPPYGNPVPPGGFPMEPFPYFHPQMPGAPLANPQPVPPPGAGPRGRHPKNGDMYRPHAPDAYIRPGMQMRPNFYPGPVSYDGYFGRPIGYCNSNERDVPFMGMGAGPAVYNRYPGQNGPDPANPRARSGGYGPSGKALVPEHDDPGHHHDARGPVKVLLKQHNGLDGKDDQKWEGDVTNVATCNEKGEQPRTSEENEWGADDKDEDINPRKTAVSKASHQTFDNKGSRSSLRNKVNSPDSMVNKKAIDNISVNKSEHAASSFSESQQPLLAAPKEYSLIQKIEGLNAKARDARHDSSSVSSMDEHRNKTQVVRANYSANEAGGGSVYHERSQSHRISTPPSHDVVSAGDRNLESTDSGVPISRRSHVMHGRSDHRGKGRINSQDAEGIGRINTQDGDGWRKRSPVVDHSNTVSAVQAGTSVVCMQEHHIPILASEKSGSYPQTKDERETGAPVFDSKDPQRAKMKERLKQRQKEEEERISRQKANARAKLEELNRRAQAVEGSGRNSGPVQNSKEGSQVLAESVTVTSEPSSTSHPNIVAQVGDSNSDRSERSIINSSGPALVTPVCAPTQSVVQNHSVPSSSVAHSADACKNTSEVLDHGMSKQKPVGFRQKQNVFPGESTSEKVSSSSISEALKGHDDLQFGTIRSAEIGTNGSAANSEPSVPVNANVNAESSMHQRRKNRGTKNKHKVEAVSSTASLPSSAIKETNPANISIANDKPMPSEPDVDSSSLQSAVASKDANQPLDQHTSLSNEESHFRVNNLSKSQSSRRVQRNPQNSRGAEKFHSGDAAIWAPVRSHNRAEVADEASNKAVVEVDTSTMKRDSVQNNYAKNKRAEIEIYVPKPVAKELALGTTQQPVVPSFGQATSNEAVESADLGSQGSVSRHPTNSDADKVGFTMEGRNADGRQNKQGKAHGSWRQRGAPRSTSTQGLQDGLSCTSNTNRNVQRAVEHQQPKKAEESSEKEQPKFSGGGNAPDVLNIPDSSDSVPVVKDLGVTGRGKRQPFRGHKSIGNIHDIDHKKIIGGDANIVSVQCLPPQGSRTEEGRVGVERSASHWQPKSQAFSGINQGSVQPDGQNFNPEVSRGMKRESSSQSEMLHSSQRKETSDVMAQPHHDHPASVKSHVEEAPNVGQQEAKGEKKMAPLKGRPYSPNQGPVGPVEPPTDSTNIRHENRSYSGFRRNGNQNNRFGRGHDHPRGDWSAAGHDDRQHNQPANRGRHNSHYEYQPVGPYNNNSKPGNVEGPNGGSQKMGARFRDRGQGNPRRGGGNYYGRQTDSVRDAGHD